MRHNDLDALRRLLKPHRRQKEIYSYPADITVLTRSVENTNITIEGENAEHTILDISDGEGPVFRLRMGRDVTIRNLTMLGHTGQADMPGTMTNVMRNSVPREISFGVLH